MEQVGATLEIKTVDVGQRLLCGMAAVHHNTDRVRDIIDPAASAKALSRLRSPAEVAVFVGHNSAMLPVGIPQKIEATPAGLYTETYILKGAAGDNLLEVARDLAAHGQSLGMSIGYKTRDSRNERHGTKSVRRLLDYELKEFSYAAAQAIANPMALVSAIKARERSQGAEDEEQAGGTAADAQQADDDGQGQQEETQEIKSEWSQRMINDLPDACFLYVEDGDKDDDGKTVPRSKRHFPYRTSSTSGPDLAHLRNAIARIPQSDLADDVKARLQARARRLLAAVQDGDASGKTITDITEEPCWQSGAAPELCALGFRLVDASEQLASELKALALLGEETKDYRCIREPLRTQLRRVGSELGRLLDFADAAERGEDGQQRIAYYQRQLALSEL